MKEPLSKEDYDLLYESLREYLCVLEKEIGEPFYITNVRRAKRGRLYKLCHKLEDQFGPFQYRHWA